MKKNDNTVRGEDCNLAKQLLDRQTRQILDPYSGFMVTVGMPGNRIEKTIMRSCSRDDKNRPGGRMKEKSRLQAALKIQVCQNTGSEGFFLGPRSKGKGVGIFQEQSGGVAEGPLSIFLNEFFGTLSDADEQVNILLLRTFRDKGRRAALIGLVGKPLQIQMLCVDIDGAWHIALDGPSYSFIQDVIDRQPGFKGKEEDNILGPVVPEAEATPLK